MNIWQWPALAGARQNDLPKLRLERGVFGKAHGAISDYRWLAATRGLISSGLEKQISLGAEDHPQRASFWRVLPDRAIAVTSYRSPSSDLAGRSNFIEKQVLTWEIQPEVPLVLAALALLPEVAGYDASIWWDRRNEGDWQRDEFKLELDDAGALVPDEGALASAIDEGVEQLRATFGSRNELLNFYERVAKGDRPALLEVGGPLSPAAVACLLLPFPRPIADKISIAGWHLASAPEFVQPEGRWDCLISPLRPAQLTLDRAPLTAKWDRPEVQVRALHKADPSLLSEYRVVSVVPARGEFIDERTDIMTEPVAVVRGKPEPARHPALPPALAALREAAAQKNVYGNLPPPQLIIAEILRRTVNELATRIQELLIAGATPTYFQGLFDRVEGWKDIERIVAFAADPEPIWREAGEFWSFIRVCQNSDEREILLACGHRVNTDAARASNSALREQWAAKRAEMRALILTMLPHPSTVETLNTIEGCEYVPPLMFLRHMPSGDRGFLNRLGFEILDRELAATQQCRNTRLREDCLDVLRTDYRARRHDILGELIQPRR